MQIYRRILTEVDPQLAAIGLFRKGSEFRGWAKQRVVPADDADGRGISEPME